MPFGTDYAKTRETKSRALWRCAVMTALLAVLPSCGAIDIPLPYRDRVTEATKTYKKFFAGRVLVTRTIKPLLAADGEITSATYYLPDGTSLGCNRLLGRTWTMRGRWDIEHNGPVGAALRTWGWNAERGKGLKGFDPIKYNRKTGWIHVGANIANYLSPPLTDGWIQNDFPAAHKKACPRLALPPDLAINKKQTSILQTKMLAQDPDAPIRNFPGTEKLKERYFFGIFSRDD